MNEPDLSSAEGFVRKYFTGIDCGSWKTRCVILTLAGGYPAYLGSSEVQSHGWSKGAIVDIRAVSDCIKEAFRRAVGQHQISVKDAVYGVGGWALRAPSREFIEQPQWSLLSVPYVGIPPGARHSLREAAWEARIYQHDIEAEPMAAARVVMTADEREKIDRFLLIDIGAESSGLFWLDNGRRRASGLLMGVEQIARNVAFSLETTLTTVRYCIDPGLFEALQDAERKELEPVREAVLREMRSEISEFACYVSNEIDAHVMALSDLPKTIVLTGGGAKLEGVVEAFERLFLRKVRVGGVKVMRAECPDIFKASPDWCTAFGLAEDILARYERWHGVMRLERA